MNASFTPRSASTRAGAKRLWRALAFLLLFVQLALVAHRIEHYLAPDRMECGEEACVAFAPAPDAPELPVILGPLVLVIYAARFWSVHRPIAIQPRDRLGFNPHAPPG
jgi:hypothetical protein